MSDIASPKVQSVLQTLSILISRRLSPRLPFPISDHHSICTVPRVQSVHAVYALMCSCPFFTGHSHTCAMREGDLHSSAPCTCATPLSPLPLLFWGPIFHRVSGRTRRGLTRALGKLFGVRRYDRHCLGHWTQRSAGTA